MKSRTKARGLAMQALYELDMTDHKVGDVISTSLATSNLSEELKDFSQRIISEIYPIRETLDEIIEELGQGNRLEFREFGVFEIKERAARKAQNPRTLEKVHVPAKRVVKFKVGRLMKQRVSEGSEERPTGLSGLPPAPGSTL